MSHPTDETDQKMEIDTPNINRRNLPHYGTKRYLNTKEPTVPSAKSVAELYEEFK